MIRLENNYVIKADEYQFILGTLYTRKDNEGKEVETVKASGYYSSLTSAYKAYGRLLTKKAIMENDYESNQVIGMLNQIDEKIDTLLKNH